jgi:hypothetical protein
VQREVAEPLGQQNKAGNVAGTLRLENNEVCNGAWEEVVEDRGGVEEYTDRAYGEESV